MLELILKLYTMAISGDVRSPVPHLFGPPGCGKSTFVEKAAELIREQTGSCNLHVINVSRISPLELEGVQMPIEENSRLHLLTATFWTQLKDGDILLLDEFLRGFPEVYNGLLDILTSRRVGSFQLPKVFIIAASNSTVAYDKALEDRLLHLAVPDPRNSENVRKEIGKVLVDEIGLLPSMATSAEMEQLLITEVCPMYDIMDQLKHRANIGAATIKGHSPRNLVGQARMRHIVSSDLLALISMNNRRAINEGKYQYVILPDGKTVDRKYLSNLKAVLSSPKLSQQQRLNMELNVQLIAMENARKDEEEDEVF